MNTYRNQAKPAKDESGVKRETVFDWGAGWKKMSDFWKFFIWGSGLALIALLLVAANAIFGDVGAFIAGSVIVGLVLVACILRLVASAKTEKLTVLHISDDYRAGFKEAQSRICTLKFEYSHQKKEALSMKPGGK